MWNLSLHSSQFPYGVRWPETWSPVLDGLGWGHRKYQIGSWSPHPGKLLAFVIGCQVFQGPFWSRRWTLGLLLPLRATWLNPKMLIHLFSGRMGFFWPFQVLENRGGRSCVEKLNKKQLFWAQSFTSYGCWQRPNADVKVLLGNGRIGGSGEEEGGDLEAAGALKWSYSCGRAQSMWGNFSHLKMQQ